MSDTPYSQYGTYADLASMDAEDKKSDGDRKIAFQKSMDSYIAQYLPSVVATFYVMVPAVTFMDYKITGNIDNAYCAFVPRLPRVYIVFSAISPPGKIIPGYTGFATGVAQEADKKKEDASRMHFFQQGMDAIAGSQIPGSLYALFTQNVAEGLLSTQSGDVLSPLNWYCTPNVTAGMPSRTYLAFGAPL